MKSLVEYIAKSLVDEPSQVSVDEKDDGDRTLYELRVAPDDLGKVIGKKGRTASAIRVILSATASKHGKKASLDIID